MPVVFSGEYEMKDEREKRIVRTSFIGIAANAVLVFFKILTGLATNSIAITLDAVNNLSDVLSSVITILGVRLAARRPDRRHPLGYGRVEYLSSLAVSALILYAGIESLIESVRKIFFPEEVTYSVGALIVLAAAVAVKLVLSVYVKRQGQLAGSATLTASGVDAGNDAVISFSVLCCALIYMKWHVSLEAYAGAVIALMILKAGAGMMTGTLDDILGRSADKETAHEIKAAVRACDERIQGAYDLILHNYGPNHFIGSIHIAVPDTMTADEIDALTRKIGADIYRQYGIALTGIGIYSINSKDDAVEEMFQKVRDIVMSHDGVIQMHGFYADLKEKKCSLDIILAWDVNDRIALFRHISADIRNAFPDFAFTINMDIEI